MLTEFATYELYPWAIMQPDGFDQPDLKGSWNVRSDETWYRNMAAGIGSARALVVEQIDLPFARRIPSTAPEQINTYAARVLSANPHTTVYIDSGTYTWLSPAQAATLLIRNGIRYARGFSLNDTGYESTSEEDVYGASIVAALAKQGVKGKRFIVDTVENGQPYMPRNVGQGKGLNDTPRCHAGVKTPCQRLGIPPTTNVASPQWDLSAAASKDARLYCDGYVWSGQPWDIDGGPFLKKYALWLAANSKYRLTTQPTTDAADDHADDDHADDDHAADDHADDNAADDNADDDNADDHPADGDRPVAITSRRGCPSISVAPCQSSFATHRPR